MITAADGEEAIELALERRPDLCVIDVMMPKLDGFEVTERVRAAPELADTTILLLTASVHESAVERASRSAPTTTSRSRSPRRSSSSALGGSQLS